MRRLALLWLPTLLLAAVVAPVEASSWQRPVDGPLLRSFALGPNPYARGWHRGIDLGAPPGTVVRSACAGRVSFAGRVPGAGGRTVSVRCGALIATYQRLGAVAVRAGRRLARGAPLGVAGPSGDGRRPHVHFGVREARSGSYVDPLTLLRGGATLPPALPTVPPWRRVDPPGATPALPPRARVPRGLPLRIPPRAPLGEPLRIPPRAPLGEPLRIPTRAPLGEPLRIPPPQPRGLPLGLAPSRPRGLPLGLAPGGAAGRGAFTRAAFGGGSSSRLAPRGAGRGATPPSSATYDPAEPPQSEPLPPVPWLVWAGLACVALALPIGGLFALQRQRRAAARRAAVAARGS